jgi:HAD superfamily hydrolase (TIGR01484 family)
LHKKYKLLALDMDGTLLNNQSNISQTNGKFIQLAIAAGVTVCLATGRGYQSAIPYALQLQLTSPLVVANGSEIWSAPGILHHRTTMPASTIHQLREIALQSDVWYWAYSVFGVHNKEHWVEQEEGNIEWLKFGFYTENDFMRNSVRNAIHQLGQFEVTNSHPWNIELNPHGISKATGLREVCNILEIEMSEVIAVGDSMNDLTMIQEAGCGVAMGNAQDELKLAANTVTSSNEEDGVAEVIKQFIL